MYKHSLGLWSADKLARLSYTARLDTASGIDTTVPGCLNEILNLKYSGHPVLEVLDSLEPYTGHI